MIGLAALIFQGGAALFAAPQESVKIGACDWKFSADGRVLACVGLDRRRGLTFCTGRRFKAVHRVPIAGVTSFDWDDRSHLLAAISSGKLLIVNAPSGRVVRRISLGTSAAEVLAIHPERGVGWAISTDAGIQFISMREGRFRRSKVFEIYLDHRNALHLERLAARGGGLLLFAKPGNAMLLSMNGQIRKLDVGKPVSDSEADNSRTIRGAFSLSWMRPESDWLTESSRTGSVMAFLTDESQHQTESQRFVGAGLCTRFDLRRFKPVHFKRWPDPRRGQLVNGGLWLETADGAEGPLTRYRLSATRL